MTGPIAAPATHSLDQPSRSFRAVWGSRIEFSGWVYMGPQAHPAEVSLEIIGAPVNGSPKHKRSFLCESLERPDVVSYLMDSAALHSGFRASVNSGELSPGDYAVDLVTGGSEAARIRNIAVFHLALHDYEVAARAGLAAKFLRGSGIEIGALQRKLPVPEGCHVQYVDRMPIEKLIEHYPELAGSPLQAPDIIDDGEKLEKIANSSQDFVIANHFLEHSVNPIQTLFNLTRVLKSGGVLYMAVPDKRYTKDAARPETTYETLRAAYSTTNRDGIDEAYREWAANWQQARGGDVERIAEALKNRGYSIHFNVWTLSKLLELMLRVRSELGIPLDLTAVVSSENENIVILTKLGD